MTFRGPGLALLALALTAATAEAVTFGEQGTGNYEIYDNRNFLTATQFSCPAAGAVNRIFFYVTVTGGASGRVALYGDGGLNLPGALLAESASQPLVTGWNAFVIPETAVTSGATYWLANQLSNTITTVGLYNDDPNFFKSRERWPYAYGSFPAPFGSPTGAQPWRFCIYATEITGTATPTPGGTATFTATRTRSATISPTPSSTWTRTRTATGTRTPTVSPTPTRSPAYSPTATPTISPTPPAAPTATISPVLTPSPTPSAAASTATPTFTPGTRAGEMRVFPQPARERVQLSYACSGAARAWVEVYNPAGERVLLVTDETFSLDGRAVTAFSTRELAAGVYYLRIQLEDQQGRRWLRGKMAIAP